MVLTKRRSCNSRRSIKPERDGSSRRLAERITNKDSAPSFKRFSKSRGETGSRLCGSDTRDHAWRMEGISSACESKRSRGGSRMNKPRRKAMRISNDQAVDRPSQMTCTLRWTIQTSGPGLNNQRAKATTKRVTIAVINSRCNRTGNARRRQRRTV